VSHGDTDRATGVRSTRPIPVTRVPAKVVAAIAAGFEHCLMVSNHTFDRGMSAFMATVERFALIGVSQHGMAVSPQNARAHLEDVDGAVIGHLSYSYSWDVDQRPCDEPWRSALIDPDLVIADTGGARDRDAVVVVGRVIGGTRGRRMRRLSNVRWRNV